MLISLSMIVIKLSSLGLVCPVTRLRLNSPSFHFPLFPLFSFILTSSSLMAPVAGAHHTLQLPSQVQDIS